MSRGAYWLKGFGNVKATYHPAFRAYEFKVKQIAYMSLGPGWANSFEYLNNALKATYNYYYLPKEGDCVIDIGAGLGEETVIYALLVGERGSVHALEANPSTYAGLKYMCEQNQFAWVVPYHLAIFNKDGTVTIEDDEENYLINTIHSKPPKKEDVRVEAKTLDTLVKECNIARIDFLKSNIEGAERYLIEGMNDSIKIIRNLCISCHDFRHNYNHHGEFYVTKQLVESFLEKHNFEIQTRKTGNRVVDDYIYARNLKLK